MLMCSFSFSVLKELFRKTNSAAPSRGGAVGGGVRGGRGGM